MTGIDPEDLPGGLKARQLLKMLACRPGPGRVCSQIRNYIEALYADIRDARTAGWSWTAIRKELGSVPEIPQISEKILSQYFCEIDRQWSKETGVAPLAVRKMPPRIPKASTPLARKRGRPPREKGSVSETEI